MKKILVLAISLACTECVFSQITRFGASTLSDSTSFISIPLVIKQGTQKIDCLFNGTLTRGSLDISLKDPEGRQQAGFSLEAEDGKTPGGARGGSKQEFRNPFPGKWELTIKIYHATGILSYQLETKP